jgi:hypothetical protein
MKGQKAHMWLNISTGERAITFYRDVKEGDVALLPQEISADNYYVFSTGNDTRLTDVQISGVSKVHYNKGNWIVIDYLKNDNSEGYFAEINSFGDGFDLVDGAKFIFNTPVGQQTLIYGEPFPDTEITFMGRWSVDFSDWAIRPGSVTCYSLVREASDPRGKWEIYVRCWSE